jgi:metal-responsive CopG/Arc/MetJ family transcriptional regulator
MRLHISLDDDLVEQLDRRVGQRGRSAFISQSLRRALDDARRREDIESGFGAIASEGHEWDADPAGWVREQRLRDPRRVG